MSCSWVVGGLRIISEPLCLDFSSLLLQPTMLVGYRGTIGPCSLSQGPTRKLTQALSACGFTSQCCLGEGGRVKAFFPRDTLVYKHYSFFSFLPPSSEESLLRLGQEIKLLHYFSFLINVFNLCFMLRISKYILKLKS